MKSKLLLFMFVLIFILTGCNKDAAQYKDEADKESYGIIDRQWRDEFGPKTNYKITDGRQSPNDIPAKPVTIPNGILTLANAVDIATEHNRQYQTQKEDLYIRALDLTLIRHAYRPNLFGKLRVGYSKDGSGGLTSSTFGFGNDNRYEYTRDIDNFVRDISTQFRKRATIPDDYHESRVKDYVREETNTLLKEHTQFDTDEKIDDFTSALADAVLVRSDSTLTTIDRRKFLIDASDDVIDHLTLEKTKIEETNDGAFSSDATFGFNQLLETGSQISTSVAFAWVDILSGNFRSGLSSLLSATITKPLLRGSTRKIALENLTQAQRNTLYQIRTFSRFRKDFVVSIINNYYSILNQLNRTDNAQSYYISLDELYTRMELFVKKGRIPLHELKEINQDKLQAWDVYTKEEKLYQQMLDDFKIAMSIVPTTDFKLDRSELDILANKSLSPPTFSVDKAIESAMANRLDLMNTADAIEDAERKIIVAKDRLRAELNLVASGQTMAGISHMTNNDSSIYMGVELDLPLDRVAERNQYRKTLIVLERQKRNHAQACDNIKHAIRQAYRNLNNAATTYRLQQQSLKLADERFNRTEQLIQYSRTNTRDILNAQKDLFKAKNDAGEALIGFRIATLKFYKDAGVMKIKEDGMWKTKQPSEKTTVKNTTEEIQADLTIASWLKKRSQQSNSN